MRPQRTSALVARSLSASSATTAVRILTRCDCSELIDTDLRRLGGDPAPASLSALRFLEDDAARGEDSGDDEDVADDVDERRSAPPPLLLSESLAAAASSYRTAGADDGTEVCRNLLSNSRTAKKGTPPLRKKVTISPCGVVELRLALPVSPALDIV